MVSEIWKRIDQVYADWPFLTIQKIRIFVVTLGFLTLLLIGLTALDLGWHHIPIGLVLVMNLSYLPFFVLGLVFTLRGFFEKVVPWVLIGSLFVMVSDSVVVGLSVNPEEFYRFAFLSFIPLLVSGALFSGRRMLLVLWGVSSVWFLLYWKFFCFGLSPELVRQSMDLAIFGVVSLGALTFLTYGLAFLFELATKKSQEQMAEIQEMNACLECRVQKRTRELEDARDMAQQATQAKSEFLANMSHEIRTPLNGILGMAQLMAKKNPQSEERELLQVILDSGHHLLSVIQDVLDYSKIEAGRLEMDCAPFPLEQLLATVSHVVGVRAQEKGLEFRMHVDSRIPPWLLGDEVRIRQVLMNLASNAVKFTEKGSASLDVEFGAREGNVVRLRFRVTDTGIGMDSAAQARIFERFAQAETSITRRFGGTGLGLAISRNLLKLMGSELLLQSSVGVGSCFEFELALGVFQPTRKLPVIKTEHKDLEVLGAGKLVLVVEDNPLNLKLSVRLLGGMGFLTEEAQNGKEALDRLSQTEFSLVLMDCQMPVLDGFSATQEIRTWKSSLNTVARSNSVIPIIGVTAEALKGSRESCLEAGMDDYIAKPFKIDQFESVLARWVQG